jgi:TolB-like protein/Flp pilus assembly protein TadD/tRNA A-37 threonylcarbamoyl transferase component Bud32
MIGQTVTHYRIIDKIGEGGMGVVYRAEDTRLGRQVAVKFLSSKLLDDPAALERFQREARAASSLNNPHICALYDIGQHEGVPFLVMELLEGTTLRSRISGTPIATDTLLDIAVQAADALDTAHSAGIVHRDIKSANIFLTPSGQVKVLDFGLAKLAARRGNDVDPYAATTLAQRHAPATESGQTFGTLSSMSPEQARGEDLDGRSDLFSFGVVLYEMATGREPFVGRTSALTFDAILNHTPARPSTLNAKIPAELEHIILKALEKDRDLRYQTAAELRADLKRLKRETDSSKVPFGGAAVSRPRARLSVAQWAMIAATLLVVIAAATFPLWRSHAGATIDSVAVLPFASVGATGDAEYLPDGMTESLINGLAQLPGLRVSARSVVFRYKGKDVDPQQIGRDLNVRAIVTGRVAARGDRLVIEAELMNVADGSQLWGGQYNQPHTNLLAVQDEIANEILDKLGGRITGEEKKRATKRYTDDAEAYELYLQGRYHWNKGTIAGYKKSIEYFEHAIEKDPKYALAYAGLADSNLMLGSYWVESLTDAKAAAVQALRLDPNLAEAHVALGHIKLWLDWDWPAAEKEFRQGIALNDSLALAHNQYAMYLATLGRLPEAISEVKRAQELDPLSPIVNADLGWYLLYSNQAAEAVSQFRKTIEFDTNSVSAHRGLGVALSETGRHDEAIDELKRALDLSENSPVMLGHLGAAYARAGRKADADAVIKQLQTLSAQLYVPSTSVAIIYAAEGDKNRALDWLQKAYDEHDFSIVQLNVAPWFEPLRGEARFQQLLANLRLKT